MINTISENKSIALSYIRICAVSLIVLCHFCQAYDNRWAYILNVGVQVFIALSGFIYGHKIIDNWMIWYKKRFLKLYIPVFIFLTLSLPLYYIFHRDVFNVLGFLCNYCNLQGFPFVFGGIELIPGTRHLWFLTAIALCYLSTPLIQELKEKGTLLFPILCILLLISYKFLPGTYAFIVSWVLLYSMGYMYACSSEKYSIIYLLAIAVTFITILMFVRWDNLLAYFDKYGRLFHDLLGCLILFGGFKFLCLYKNIRMNSFLSLIDKYSYHIYIIHYFFLIGPFSLAHITHNNYINILIAIVTIIAFTALLVYLSNSFVRTFINK
ncbi:MAG: acyltransferase [Bacteroidaceae bacterium]|jgi:peptidoglycan/LPS O-acetylase OafA/YrhL|nr:acyltransferase [Bacteroidaceae bacterium]